MSDGRYALTPLKFMKTSGFDLALAMARTNADAVLIRDVQTFCLKPESKKKKKKKKLVLSIRCDKEEKR